MEKKSDSLFWAVPRAQNLGLTWCQLHVYSLTPALGQRAFFLGSW